MKHQRKVSHENKNMWAKKLWKKSQYQTECFPPFQGGDNNLFMTPKKKNYMLFNALASDHLKISDCWFHETNITQQNCQHTMQQWKRWN